MSCNCPIDWVACYRTACPRAQRFRAQWLATTTKWLDGLFGVPVPVSTPIPDALQPLPPGPVPVIPPSTRVPPTVPTVDLTPHMLHVGAQTLRSRMGGIANLDDIHPHHLGEIVRDVVEATLAAKG